MILKFDIEYFNYLPKPIHRYVCKRTYDLHARRTEPTSIPSLLPAASARYRPSNRQYKLHTFSVNSEFRRRTHDLLHDRTALFILLSTRLWNLQAQETEREPRTVTNAKLLRISRISLARKISSREAFYFSGSKTNVLSGIIRYILVYCSECKTETKFI